MSFNRGLIDVDAFFSRTYTFIKSLGYRSSDIRRSVTWVQSENVTYVGEREGGVNLLIIYDVTDIPLNIVDNGT